jgi:hypothetical protein
MSYDEKWKILADFLIELQETGKKTPAEIMDDLRSAKTIIHILKADPTHTESISRIETYLKSVESYVIFTAEQLGTETVEEWLKKLEGKIKMENNEKREASSKFIPGIPRDKNWVRIQISEDTPIERVKKLVAKSKLSYKKQKNGYMIVYGNKDNITLFVKSMVEQFRGPRNR